MLANEMKKGMKIVMRGTGWSGTVYDNAKGIIRMCEIEGVHTEIGSVYVFNIAKVLNPATGQWEPVTLSPAQEKQRSTIAALGF